MKTSEGNLELPAYTRISLDEDKEETTSETINVRLNATDRIRLDELRWILNESKDGTVIKYALELAKNVLQIQLSERSWIKICSQTRKPDIMKRPKSLEKT